MGGEVREGEGGGRQAKAEEEAGVVAAGVVPAGTGGHRIVTRFCAHGLAGQDRHAKVRYFWHHAVLQDL